jgi:hypothetical protein
MANRRRGGLWLGFAGHEMAIADGEAGGTRVQHRDEGDVARVAIVTSTANSIPRTPGPGRTSPCPRSSGAATRDDSPERGREMARTKPDRPAQGDQEIAVDDVDQGPTRRSCIGWSS